jgi:hypothetical protein
MTTTPILQDDDGYGYDEPPTCGICDGYHGYFCPLESPDPGYYADELAAGR